MQDKFSVLEVTTLRNELMNRGLDSLQVADAIKVFVARRGYAISPEIARDMASRVEGIGCTVESLHMRLETLALAM